MKYPLICHIKLRTTIHQTSSVQSLMSVSLPITTWMVSHFHKIHHFSSQDTPRISYLCLSYVFPKSELSISVGLKSRQLWCTKYFHCISLIIQRTSENVCPLCSTSLQLPINFRTILCLPIALINSPQT